MANRRHGISWSLSGKVDVYRGKVDPFRSVCGVRKEKIQRIYQSKGMACSVYVKKDDKDVAHFVTWSGLTKHLNKGAQMNYFSSKRFGKHSASIDSESTVETFGHFSFFPAGSIFASLSSKKFRIITFRPLQQQEFTTDLEAYCFFGSEKLKLKLKFERDTETHKLLTSDTSGTDRKLEWSSVLGAPIIVKNNLNISARNSSRWSVVGVVGLSLRERELCPHFVENKIFEQDASGLPFNDVGIIEVGASAHTSQSQHNASHPTDELDEVGASAHMNQSQHNASHPTDELHEVGASAHMSQLQHNASHPTDELHEVGASAHMSQSQRNARHPTDELHEVGASADMSQSQHNASHPTDELHEVGASAHVSQSQHNASRLTDKLHEVGASAKQRKTGSPSQQELLKLSGKVASKWKVLARVLGVDEDSIDVIEHDYNTVVERCHQSLLIWKRDQGVEDNNYYKVLETGLCDSLVGRRDLAEEFCYY